MQRQISKDTIRALIENDSIEVIDMEYLKSETTPKDGFRTYEWNGLIIVTLKDKSRTK